MLLAKNHQQKTLKLSLYHGDKCVYNFALDKKKLLVGSAPHADIKIEDNRVSYYHAFIILNEEGGAELIDLASDNGSFVNGKRIQKSFFSEGDLIRFSELEFQVSEFEIEGKIENRDQNIKKTKVEEIFIPSRNEISKKGLVLIDGEYCDITFKDNYKAINELPVENTLNFNSFVDYVDEDKNVTSKDILKSTDGKSIEVSILSMGNIISVDYMELSGGDQTFYFSNKNRSKDTLVLETLDEGEKIPFLKANGGKIHVCKINGYEGHNFKKRAFNIFQNNDFVVMEGEDTISYVWKSVQIFVRVVNTPPKTKFAPFFGRDRQFQKDAGKVFSILFSIMLLLLLVDITPPAPPEKKLAIVYKRAPKVEKPKTPEANSTLDDNQGVKEHHKPDKKIEMAKKSDPAPAAKAAKAESAPAPAKMAAYEFKSNSLNSLFSSDSMKSAESSKTGRSAATKNFEGVAGDASSLKTGTGTNAGTLGSDATGTGSTSSGAKGLISKNGTDSTYVEPKTVILGSIDPELLRKILQEYIPQFRHCYQQELETNEAIQGVVDLNFRIENNGSVSKVNIKVKNASFSANGTNCMANVLKVIDFPKPKGGGHVDVRQPLNFFSERSKM